VVVPTAFYKVPPGNNLTPGRWIGVNLCSFDASRGRAGCKVDGVEFGDLAQNMNHGVLELWSWPSDPRREPWRKWASAPLLREDEE
jgi:hypothetical protein